jgi:hypothetical protein
MPPKIIKKAKTVVIPPPAIPEPSPQLENPRSSGPPPVPEKTEKTITLREGAQTVFNELKIEANPLSCLLVPLTHCSNIRKIAVKTHDGDSYDALAFVVPVSRIPHHIQQVPASQVDFCNPPTNHTVASLPEGYTPESRELFHREYPLSYSQLIKLRELFGVRPRKALFDETLKSIGFLGDIEKARKQYLIYRNGPLDDTELQTIFAGGCSSVCKIEEFEAHLPVDGVDLFKAHSQWVACCM